MKNKITDFFKLFIDSYIENNIPLYATQAAFFLIISAVPFAMFLLSLLRVIFPMSDSELLAMINQSIPHSLEYYSSKVLNDLYTSSSISLTSITAITSLWAASKSTHALTLGLNSIYRTKRQKSYLNLRISAIFNTVLLILVILISLILIVFGTQIDSVLTAMIGQENIFTTIFNIRNAVSLALISVIFTFLYTVLPNKVLKFYHQIPGAVMATGIWLLFSFFYSYYVELFASKSITYGVMAVLVFTMVWLQICMIIFLTCAQFNVTLYEIKHGYEDHDK